MNESIIESRLRRRLKKHGFYLSKTTARHWSREWYGVGYTVFETYTNNCILGCWNRMWQATLNDVEEFVRELEEKAAKESVA